VLTFERRHRLQPCGPRIQVSLQMAVEEGNSDTHHLLLRRQARHFAPPDDHIADIDLEKVGDHFVAQHPCDGIGRPPLKLVDVPEAQIVQQATLCSGLASNDVARCSGLQTYSSVTLRYAFEGTTNSSGDHAGPKPKRPCLASGFVSWSTTSSSAACASASADFRSSLA